jgi:hypothetical protein
MSERRACSLVAADRKMIRYRSRRPADPELRARLRELANQRRRFGYRRLYILLRDEGEPSGINRIYRLYREEGLAVRKRRSRRKAVGTRVPRRVASSVGVSQSIQLYCRTSKCSLLISSFRQVGRTVRPSPEAKPAS